MFYLSALWVGHLENIGSLNYNRASKFDIFHYKLSEASQLLISPPICLLKFWEADKLTVVNMFSKIPIHAWELKFYHWQENFVICLPWSNRLTLFILEKKSATHLTGNNHSYYSLMIKTDVPWKNSQLKTVLSVLFPLGNHCILMYSRSTLTTLHFVRIIKRQVLKDWYPIKLITALSGHS